MKTKADKFRGITEKVLKDGTTAIYVRFKYLSKTHPVKNFTKLYGCKTKTAALKELEKIKVLLSKGIDPFNTMGTSLNDYFYKSLELNQENGNWRKTTVIQYSNFYEGYIKKSIGHKKLDKITYEDLEKILENLNHTKGSYRNRIYRILTPFFDKAIKRGEINNNPCESLKYEKVDKKEKLEKRVIEDKLTIARILYKAFVNHKARYTRQRGEVNIYFLLLLLSGHRQNEIIQLTRDDCYLDEGKIISPASITKTKTDYDFPIPKECKEWIKNKNSGELLFPNMNLKSIYFQFQNILDKTEIQLYKDKKFSPHDMRSLLLNIMIQNCKVDSRLADTCLEHKQEKVIEHYLNFSYKDKKKAFKKYWKKIRNKNPK